MAVEGLPRSNDFGAKGTGRPEEAPLCQGYLDKRGSKGFHPQMRRRYFVLRGGILRYFEEKGTIDVRGKRVRADPVNPRLLELQDQSRTWELLAETQAERDHWVENLDRVSKLQAAPCDGDEAFGRWDGSELDSIEEVLWEHQHLTLAGDWSPNVGPGIPRWTAADGAKDCNPNKIALPDGGWEWTGEWYVKNGEGPSEGWQYAQNCTPTTAWSNIPPRALIPLPWFRRREWGRLRVPKSDRTATAAAISWHDHLLQQLKAVNAAMDEFVAGDEQKRWHHWHTACDMCGAGVSFEKVTLVCEHKACPTCVARLLQQQEEYNAGNLASLQRVISPMVVCQQCYRPTFLKVVQTPQGTNEYRTDYKKCLPKYFAFRIHEVYEIERNWMSGPTPKAPEWCSEDMSSTMPYEIPSGEPWFWVMGWTVDHTSRAVDSQGWEYALQPANPNSECRWSPQPTSFSSSLLSRFSLGNAVAVRRRRHMRLEVSIRQRHSEPHDQTFGGPSLNGWSFGSVAVSSAPSDSFSSNAITEDASSVQLEAQFRSDIEAQWLREFVIIQEIFHREFAAKRLSVLL